MRSRRRRSSCADSKRSIVARTLRSTVTVPYSYSIRAYQAFEWRYQSRKVLSANVTAWIEEEKRCKNAALQPLPAVENAAQSEAASRNVQKLPQHRCRLLSKLPLEIRQYIWDLVFADPLGRELHITKGDRRLTSLRCCRPRHDDTTGLGHQRHVVSCRYHFGCWGACYDNGDHRSSLWTMNSRSIFGINVADLAKSGVALLRTCRAIYEEALPTLYSKNLFCVRQAALVSSMAVTIPSAQLALIRSLHLDFALNPNLWGYSEPLHWHTWISDGDDMATWTAACGVLRDHLTALKSLRIGISPARAHWIQRFDGIEVVRILWELREVHVSERGLFVVDVRNFGGIWGVLDDIGTMPFELRLLGLDGKLCERQKTKENVIQSIN